LTNGIFGVIATRRMRSRLNWESPGIGEDILAVLCRKIEGLIEVLAKKV
jgi:hypothetical protein